MAVEVVVEPRTRPLLLRLVGGAGHVPAANRGRRVAAEARPAGAEEDDGARIPRQLGEGRLGLGDVGGLLGDGEMRQAPAAVVVLEPGEGWLQPVDPWCELGLGQAVWADGAGQAAGDRLPVG